MAFSMRPINLGELLPADVFENCYVLRINDEPRHCGRLADIFVYLEAEHDREGQVSGEIKLRRLRFDPLADHPILGG